MKNLNTFIASIVIVFTLFSCDDYLDIEPIGKVTPKTAVDYRNLLTSAYNIPKNDKILSTYRTDELFLTPNTIGIEQYENIYIWKDDNNEPNTKHFSYLNFYTTIFYANEIINNKDNITGNNSDLNQLVGEAYALRALQYFDLINLYGNPYDATTSGSDKGVPIVTEYDVNQEYTKNSVQEVYNQIVSDIENAEKYIQIDEQVLGKNYRFSKLAVKALKSEIYLYMQDWQKAISAAEEALNINSNLQNLNTNFDIIPSEYSSIESILALNIVSSFDIAANTYIAQDLINLYDKTNDLRFNNYYNESAQGVSTKKTASTKFRCTLRTADLYLILAEAEANLENLDQAKFYLLKLAENRYNATGYNSFKNSLSNLNQQQLLDVIYKERQREFAIEGKRWFDLRRTTQDRITKNYNGNTYILEKGDARYTLPIPREAKINNPFL